MVTTMLAVAMGLTQKAWAAPREEGPLPWDAVAQSGEPLVVTDFEWVSRDQNYRRIKPTRGCVGDVCGSLNISNTLNITDMETECKEQGSFCITVALLGGVPILVGALVGISSLAALADPDIATTEALKFIGYGSATMASGAGLMAAPLMMGERKNRRQSLHYTSEQINAMFRRAYVEDREAYLHLRDQYAACIDGSNTPLTPSQTERTSARAACDAYTKKLGQYGNLRADFAEASTEVKEATAAWDAIPMLQRLASGDYLGFYQERETLPLASLPAPVAQDVCDRVRDATSGKAIADALLRKKLGAWASETCPGVE